MVTQPRGAGKKVSAEHMTHVSRAGRKRLGQSPRGSILKVRDESSGAEPGAAGDRGRGADSAEGRLEDRQWRVAGEPQIREGDWVTVCSVDLQVILSVFEFLQEPVLEGVHFVQVAGTRRDAPGSRRIWPQSPSHG